METNYPSNTNGTALPTEVVPRAKRRRFSAGRIAPRRLGVPHDVAVAGFDGIEGVAATNHVLTIVVQPTYESAALAMVMLQEGMQGITGPSRSHLLPTEMIVRHSTITPAG